MRVGRPLPPAKASSTRHPRSTRASFRPPPGPAVATRLSARQLQLPVRRMPEVLLQEPAISQQPLDVVALKVL
jgi:hypothetical protein